MNFFTADTHLFHRNLIEKFNMRPFTTIVEMNDEIMKRWNSKVRTNDTVYVVGDFILQNKNYTEFVMNLNGTIKVVPGDHDYLLYEIPNKLIITKQVITVNDIVLCHWPMLRWPKSHYRFRHLYGHIHRNTVPQIGKAMNIGVDVHDYFPLSEDEVNTKMKLLPENPNIVTKNK